MSRKIKLTKEIKHKAVKFAKLKLKDTYNRFGFDDKKRLNQIIIGNIGEFAFEKVLIEQGFNYEFDFYQEGRTKDNFDFCIHGGLTIEVKTSAFYNQYGFSKLNLLYSQDQYQAGLKKGFDYCAVLMIEGKTKQGFNIDLCNFAFVAGYIKYKNIAKYKQEARFFGDNYKVPLNQLINR